MEDEPKQRGGARPGAGRKPLSEHENTVPITIRLTPTLREKLRRLGGALWVRRKIEQAKE